MCKIEDTGNSQKPVIEETSMNKIYEMKELETIIKNLKVGKSCGQGLISNEILKASLPVMAKCILKNLCLDSSIYPQEWTIGYIVPIYKSGCKDNLNCCSITLNSCLGNVFYSIYTTQ